MISTSPTLTAACSGVHPLGSHSGRSVGSIPRSSSSATAPALPAKTAPLRSPCSTAAADAVRSTARSDTQSTSGTMVAIPSASGRAIRRSRCPMSRPSPRLRHSMAVKNPLSRKNTGIRNPWMAHNSSSNGPSMSLVESWAGQKLGKKDSEA